MRWRRWWIPSPIWKRSTISGRKVVLVLRVVMAGLIPAISMRIARRATCRDRRDKPGDDTVTRLLLAVAADAALGAARVRGERHEGMLGLGVRRHRMGARRSRDVLNPFVGLGIDDAEHRSARLTARGGVVVIGAGIVPALSHSANSLDY